MPRTETAPAETAQSETAQAETAQAETAQAETAQAETARTETPATDPTTVVGFSGPGRPAWQPMQVKPRPKPDGITILGTTLTRRQAAIGGAVLLVLVLLLAFLIPQAFGGDDKATGGKGKAAAPVASAKAPATKGSAAAQPPTAPTKAATTPSAPAPASGVAITLPAGWYLYKDKATGFSVPVPKNFAVSHQGSEVYFRERGGQYRLLIVDQTSTPAADPVKDWASKESDRIGSYRNYHRVGIRKVTYWDSAADWEYTYDSNSGNPLHVVKRGFITAKDQAYGITWSTSAEDWTANKANLDLIYKGFIPAKS
jgi:hypothetical protein